MEGWHEYFERENEGEDEAKEIAAKISRMVNFLDMNVRRLIGKVRHND